MKVQATVVVMLLSVVSGHAQKSEAELFRDAQRLYASGKLTEAEKMWDLTR